MVHGKTYYTIIFSFVTLTLLLGCKRISKEDTTIHVKAHLPHDGTPIPGIKWKIIETKLEGYFEPAKATGWEIEGETNGLGIADIKFNCKRNSDYQYTIYFDFDDMNLPMGTYVKTGGPTFANLDRNAHTNYEIRMLPKMDIQFHYLNTNCFDGSDSFKWRMVNYDERPYDNINNYPWVETSPYQGCCNFQYTTTNGLAGHYAFEWEAVRNGQFESGTDTFFVSPGVNNNINIYW